MRKIVFKRTTELQFTSKSINRDSGNKSNYIDSVVRPSPTQSSLWNKFLRLNGLHFILIKKGLQIINVCTLSVTRKYDARNIISMILSSSIYIIFMMTEMLFVTTIGQIVELSRNEAHSPHACTANDSKIKT